MLAKVSESKEVTDFLSSCSKPVVLLHLGMDKNPQELAQALNYRFHKVWSLENWRQIIQRYKDKYQFVQVHASQINPDLPDCVTIKVDSLNPILQILESNKCKFFMATDNNLAHLAASIKKRGIVMWGSVSPYVWGWDHNINIWNKHSCSEIACWRPGMFDSNNVGQTWLCPHYSCMRSISVDQVCKEIEKLENDLIENTDNQRIIL